jgi:glutamate-1-semialdehyde 2,1-aminomutase
MSERYHLSEEYLARALRTIPLGSQTFSKSKTSYPEGVSPYFITRGKGSHVWDLDGNEYVDFISSLAAITLGHDDPDVTAAVEARLHDGVIFSLPHPIEVQTAEKLVEMVPCAEMVRFGKNGSDATAGAVRLARAYTGRDHVAACGYHGWQDWYIGTTARNRGVPQATRDLTHTFAYNDLESLHTLFRQWRGQIAAVILEPMNTTEPVAGFLEGVQELARRNGALLVFDETITGFRFSKGGAQELFGVTPDLAAFGKGLANGYPLSAIAGKADIMRLMEEIFFSFTFGGEVLSLTASLATMTKLQTHPVIETLRERGEKLKAGTQKLIEQHGVGHFLSVTGNPVWSFLIIKEAGSYTPWQIKTLFLQEMFARDILTLATHNLNYAHSDEDIRCLLSAYDEVFPVLRDAVDNTALEKYLRCKPLEPLFKIR